MMTRYRENAQDAIVRHAMMYDENRQRMFDHWQKVSEDYSKSIDPVNYAIGYMTALQSAPDPADRNARTEIVLSLMADEICRRTGRSRLW